MSTCSTHHTVSKVTTRTRLSKPGCTCSTRVNSHRKGGNCGFLTMTNSLTSTSGCGFYHLFQTCKACKESFDQEGQIYSCITCTSCHRDNRFALISSTESSGTETSGRPIRKWLGVSAGKSLGSS